MRRLACALIHHPVLDRRGEVVTTAITSIDLHDVSRTALTYGLSHVFVTHPIAAQRELADRVRHHWVTGAGARRIPDRKPAMELLRIVAGLEDVIAELGGDREVELWTTSARRGGDSSPYADARRALAEDGPAVLLCFGTGWGLAPAVDARAARRLEPIHGVGAYNHLSVRAAAAIILDRLVSEVRAPGTA